MADNFEKILNDSLIRICEKYKDTDDSLDRIIEIDLESTTSSSMYGDEIENFSFISNRRYLPRRIKHPQSLRIHFNMLYDFLFTIDTVDDILRMI